MKPSYEDIKKRIDEEPKWYDHHGVPRYEEFNPELTSNIYAENSKFGLSMFYIFPMFIISYDGRKFKLIKFKSLKDEIAFIWDLVRLPW